MTLHCICAQLEPALIYDAVQLFTTSIYNLSKEFEISETSTPCNSSLSWKHGFTLINYMKMAVSNNNIISDLFSMTYTYRIVKHESTLGWHSWKFSGTIPGRNAHPRSREFPILSHDLCTLNEKKNRIQKDFKGLTGKIKFDQEGFRTDIELELVDLTQDGLRVTGTWSTKTGINVSAIPKSETVPGGKEFDLRNMSFVVITALVCNQFFNLWVSGLECSDF